jgi:hypothetical protein
VLAYPVHAGARKIEYKYDSKYKTFIDDKNPISLLASTDCDTMYWDQAIKQHDSAEFIKDAINEITTHQENSHWEVIPLDDVPKEKLPFLMLFGE